MIHIKNLCLNYDDKSALDNICFNIEKNSTCAIIGPSGCGKTSLLYILAGLIRESCGEVLIEGKTLQGYRKATGVILQDLGLLPWKTVWHNIALGLKSRDIDKNIIDEKVKDILKELNLTEHINKYPHELSGGEKQRVAIGRTLVLNPDLLLCDEATSALDEITKEQLQNLILELYKNHPMTLVLVTHSIEEAVFLGQNIVVMEKGRIKKVISNPYFGQSDIREKDSYYSICREVRKWLYQE
ncbi:NitT/TauT family transport system ATP-binding protein [Clostridium punense]|uniref:NitT/TauT family transport system ATP-binding protein n=1 Tax=Clostridium punense TaxID=1054297 RepID=A0ABS4K9E8_9CLOT|nr:ABC transporter ATP-binding protein [Clostridium punense]MBP2024408.1 NitT/TauT family transport system ATP-binding protein [Clostridium punense]